MGKIACTTIAGFLAALLFVAQANATEPKWIIKGSGAFGCVTELVVRQLHTMSILPSALDMALNQKLDAGECKSLPGGEVLVLVSKAIEKGHTVYCIRRSSGEVLYIDAKFAVRSI